MKRFLAMAAVAATVALPVKADLVIQGRAAQALHCSAMLFMVSSEMRQAGLLTSREEYNAQYAAVQMLNYVPGTQAEKEQAMKQRFARLMRTRTKAQLYNEFDQTFKWCTRTFL